MSRGSGVALTAAVKPPLRSLLLTLLVTALAALAVPPADAGWRPEQPVGGLTPGFGSLVDVATNARGDSVAVHLETRTVAGSPTRVAVLLRRPAGRSWSAPVVVSETGREAVLAAVAIAADGRALVGLAQSASGGSDVVVRSVSSAGALGPVRTLQGAGSGQVSGPSVALDAAGRAAVAWSVGGTAYAVRGTVTSLGPPDTLSTGGGLLFGVDAAVSGAGDVDVVWERDVESPQQYSIETCRWESSDAGCGTPVVVAGFSLGNLAEYPSLAVLPSGDAVLCYDYRGSNGDVPRALWARRPAGGTWSASSDLRPGSGSIRDTCEIGLRPDGTAVAVYSDPDGNFFAGTTNGGGFDHWQLLTAPGQVYGAVRLAVGPRGDVAVVYASPSSTTATAAVLAPGSRELTRITPVLRPSTGATLNAGWSTGIGVDDQGNAYVLGVEARCSGPCFDYQQRTSTVAYDAAPPTVGSISRPAQARVGARVTIKAVGVTDRVSTTKATWRFSDGTTSSGLTARKKVTKAGTLGITLTVTDADGRRTVKTSSIKVRR